MIKAEITPTIPRTINISASEKPQILLKYFFVIATSTIQNSTKNSIIQFTIDNSIVNVCNTHSEYIKVVLCQ